MDGDLAILRLTSPSCCRSPSSHPHCPSQGAVPTGEVVTTGYGKTSNAGFPNERREVFLDVTPRWTCEGIYQFVKQITPGMNCIRKSGRTAAALGDVVIGIVS